MNKGIIFSIAVIVSLTIITGCNSKSYIGNNRNNENVNGIVADNNSNEVIRSLKATIDEKEYIINLEDNETVKSFVNLLPQKLNMSDLNGNEKYVYLSAELPVNSYNPNHINKGDVMLFDNNCLVIFYKSFDTSYSYTKIGHIDNLPDLGSSDILVRIDK